MYNEDNIIIPKTSEDIKMEKLNNTRYKKLPLNEDTLTECINKITAKLISIEENSESKVTEMLEKSVSDGKSAIASAITEMGVCTETDATFLTLSNNIKKIGSDSNVTESDILKGKKAYVKGKIIVGNIENIEEKEYTPGKSNIIIPSKHHLLGDQIIKGDPNLIPKNIIKGTSIFGVLGTGTTGNYYEGYIEPQKLSSGNPYNPDQYHTTVREQFIDIGFKPDLIITLPAMPNIGSFYEDNDEYTCLKSEERVIVGDPLTTPTNNIYYAVHYWNYEWANIKEMEEAHKQGSNSYPIYHNDGVSTNAGAIEFRDTGFYIHSFPLSGNDDKNSIPFTAIKWRL